MNSRATYVCDRLHWGRFDHEEEHQQSSPDPGKKKRKFQQEYLILPLSKHKFRDRPCSPSISSHGSSSAVTQLESDETSEGSMASDRRQLSWGSPSINNSRGSSENPIPCSPSWASSSLQSNRYSQCGSVLNDAAVAINSTGSPSDDGILTEAGEEALETYDDYVGDLPQASTEELTTCSTDLTSDISLYFSPKWGIKRDIDLSVSLSLTHTRALSPPALSSSGLR